jgi:stage V sporulation protein D (sporulation-specific penicillin-binding protein)
MKLDSFLFRSRFLIFILVSIAIVFIVKLFILQIIRKDTFVELAERQYVTPSSDRFERGSIFFQKKDLSLVAAAGQVSGFKVALNPNIVSKLDTLEIYKKINNIVPLDFQSFELKAKKTNDTYEEILNRISKKEADEINLLKIPGVTVYREKWRLYPGGNMASHVLGFLGFRGDEFSGRYGLERTYDKTLSRSKDNPYVNFFAEVFSNINERFFTEERSGGNLITTIEPVVQGFLEKTLENVQDKYSSQSIGGIIMNPKTGAIYAMSVKPDFDINNFSSNKNASIFANPLVENVFEFGSVVKPLVLAAALDKGVITADTAYNDLGSVVIEGKVINNFDKKGRGPNTTMQQVLSQSLNTGMVLAYQKLGKESFKDYMFGYKIRDKTGIDLPNETNGLFGNLNSPREIEFANASFGQGIAFTPIGLTRALASLGNGGKIVTPHLVKEIRYDDGGKKVLEYPVSDSKISKEAGEEITRMLVDVMDKSLKNGKAKFEHHSVAVKTGTAQVAKEEGGGYYPDRNLHSFFGYFPAYDPEFIVFLYTVYPRGVRFASETWADPFLDITKFLLNYYEVAPDR